MGAAASGCGSGVVVPAEGHSGAATRGTAGGAARTGAGPRARATVGAAADATAGKGAGVGAIAADALTKGEARAAACCGAERVSGGSSGLRGRLGGGDCDANRLRCLPPRARLRPSEAGDGAGAASALPASDSEAVSAFKARCRRPGPRR